MGSCDCSYGRIDYVDDRGHHYTVDCACGGTPDATDDAPFEPPAWEPELPAPPRLQVEPGADPLFPGSR